jgi:hypothetical protein
MSGVGGQLIEGSPFSVKIIRQGAAVSDGGGGKRPGAEEVTGPHKCLWSGAGGGLMAKLAMVFEAKVGDYFMVGKAVDVRAGDILELQAVAGLTPLMRFMVDGQPSVSPVGLIEVKATQATRTHQAPA